MSRILVAGMGNVLRRDDGFGVEVAQRLMREGSLPAGVTVVEVGIGGIHLVQELMAGYDMVVVIDAVERGSTPGTVHLLAAEVPDLADWSDIERADFLADTHYTTPAKAMILARALGVLPPRVFILGCQPGNATDLGIGLTSVVELAAAEAVAVLANLVGGCHEESSQDRLPLAAAAQARHDDG